MIKVTLISATSGNEGLQRDRWYATLGLVWIGNYLQSHGHHVEILDGQILTVEDIIKNISGGLVGINYCINSTKVADRIAIAAKMKGATVVYGGQAATPLAKEILTRNPSVDFVVCGDGEKAMEMLTRRIGGESIPLNDIPNLAFRHGGEVQFTNREEIDLTSLPFPNRQLPGIDMNKLIQNFQIHGSEENFACRRPSNAFIRKGCPRRRQETGCSFCARVDLNVRSRTVEQAYDEYRYLADQFHVDYICDDSDTWIHQEWLEQLLDMMERRGPIGARFRVYGDVRDINPVTAKLLKKVGVDAVLVGMESGDENILNLNGKPLRQKHMLKAAELLGENDLKICDAYVLGLIGESELSLARTRSFASKVRQLCTTQITYWNLILPLPGSPLWKMMMSDELLYKKYNGEYRFDMEELRIDFINKFCKLGEDGYKHLLAFRDMMLSDENLEIGEYLR